MPFDNTSPGANIDPRRIKAFFADFIGDLTKGSNANLQSFIDFRRMFKQPVRVATEAALPAYTRTANVINGTGNNSLNTLGIDGVTTLAIGDRLLFKDGVSTADNGLYIINALGTETSANFQMTRTADADVSLEVRPGLMVMVMAGTENADSLWVMTNDTNPTLNTTGLTFSKIASATGDPVKTPVRLATNAALPANTRTGDVLTGVGTPAPVAAPTLATATTGGTIAAGTYRVAITYVTAAGETVRSPEATIVTTGATSTITVTVPALVTGITATGVYISAAGGGVDSETLQGTTATTTFVLSAPPVVGAALPVSNTSYALLGNIDSTAPAVGNRILVKDEVTGANNGIFILNTVGTSSVNFVLTRAADADASTELAPGILVSVNEGTANLDSLWMLTNNAVTINSTALTFVKIAGAAPTLFKAPVRLVTTAPLHAYTRVGNVITSTALIAVGTTEAGAVAGQVDGVAVAAGNRILLKDGAAAADNGIWVVTTLGVVGTTAFVLTRADDADSSAEMLSGMATYALAGVRYADTLWTMTSPDTAVTLNTSALTFAQYGSTMQKDPVRVATAVALPAYTRSTNVITSTGAGTNLNTAGIDGVTTLAVGDRILLKNGASNVDNGIWVVTTLGVDGSVDFVLTRATDADTSARMRSGTQVAVESGTLYANTVWSLTTDNNIILNTTAITFSQLGVVAANPDSTVKRGADSTIMAANHASIGSAGSAGTVVVLDGAGKVPAAALSGSIQVVADVPTAKALTGLAVDGLVMIKDFGLYRFAATQAEPDDDETVIDVTAGGQLIMEEAHADAIYAYVDTQDASLQDQIDDLAAIVSPISGAGLQAGVVSQIGNSGTVYFPTPYTEVPVVVSCEQSGYVYNMGNVYVDRFTWSSPTSATHVINWIAMVATA